MSSRLAVIPARGGSKRIKNKNIRDFAGRPMICHILQSAVDSELFRDIHVSTDSKLIRDEVNKLGPFASFERPSSLADDDQPIFSTLKYVLSRFHAKGMFFDEIWLLMACAALIEPEDLRLAAASYGQFGGGKNLLAVALTQHLLSGHLIWTTKIALFLSLLMLSQWTQNKCGADIMMLVLLLFFHRKVLLTHQMPLR